MKAQIKWKPSGTTLWFGLSRQYRPCRQIRSLWLYILWLNLAAWTSEWQARQWSTAKKGTLVEQKYQLRCMDSFVATWRAHEDRIPVLSCA